MDRGPGQPALLCRAALLFLAPAVAGCLGCGLLLRQGLLGVSIAAVVLDHGRGGASCSVRSGLCLPATLLLQALLGAALATLDVEAWPALGGEPSGLAEEAFQRPSYSEVSVVIPTCQEPEAFLRATLVALFANTESGLLREVIVVDDASDKAVSEGLGDLCEGLADACLLRFLRNEVRIDTYH